MGLDLVLLTCGASLDIVRDLLVHFRPLIEFLDFPKCFIPSGVSGGGMIMEFL